MAASLKLLTSGAIGEAELLARQSLLQRSVHKLSTLVQTAQAESVENAILDVLADTPWVLHLDMPFDAADLRTPQVDSSQYPVVHDLLRAFLARAKTHSQHGNTDGIIIGREYGLTLVPMQPAAREEIRRMAALTALVTQQVDTYEIHFSGGAHLTVKAPPITAAGPSHHGAVEDRVIALMSLVRTLRQAPDANTADTAYKALQQALRLTLSTPTLPEGYHLIRTATHAERSWPEDASHENGAYHNECISCQRTFTGHKRRAICRVCADAAENDAITQYYQDRNRGGWFAPRHSTASDSTF